MAYTQAEIDNLKSAVARGVTSVERNGEKVAYASLAAMRRQIAVMESEIQGQASGAVTVIYPSTSRGL